MTRWGFPLLPLMSTGTLDAQSKLPRLGSLADRGDLRARQENINVDAIDLRDDRTSTASVTSAWPICPEMGLLILLKPVRAYGAGVALVPRQPGHHIRDASGKNQLDRAPTILLLPDGDDPHHLVIPIAVVDPPNFRDDIGAGS